jgi:hypothetical protein
MTFFIFAAFAGVFALVFFKASSLPDLGKVLKNQGRI